MENEKLSNVDLSNIYKRIANAIPDFMHHLKSPDHVDDNLLLHFYNLNKSTSHKKKKKNDALNPNDLNNLGENEYGKFIYNQIIDINTIIRKENTYVGLKNLGATCYMNSILQLLFMNTAFRQEIYNLSCTDSVINQLQILFASLQSGNQTVCDPKPFTDMINLKTNVQQDLQEFFKALITYIEEIFEYSGGTNINPVREQFRGNLNYITRCLDCSYKSINPSYFYELEIPISDTPTTLEECIENYVSIEVLSGSNQYRCENCKCMRDAERCLDLVKMPEILSFQLMRFVYDFEKDAKLKVSTPISFPTTLSMEKYLRRYERKINNEISNLTLEVEENKQEYQLNSILIHQGKSAYEGHYIAIIRNDNTGEWWKFDDEKSTNLGKDIYSALQATTKKKKSKNNDDEYKEQSYSKKRNNLIISPSAYMITYKRVGSKVINPIIPDTIKKVVEKNNQSYQDIVKNTQLEQKCINDTYNLFKEEYNTVWNNLKPNTEKSNFISTEWLQKWISGEIFYIDQIFKLQAKSNELPFQKADELLNNMNSFLLGLPISHYVKLNEEGNNHLLFVDFQNQFLCEHGNLDFVSLDKIKRISSDSWNYLSSKYNITPSITEKNLCKLCCFSILKKGENCYKELERKSNLLNNIASEVSNSKEFYFISKEWYNLFKKQNNGNELNELINDSLLCTHGKLYPSKNNITIINGDSWKLLKEMFPNAIEFRVSKINEPIMKKHSSKNKSKRLKTINKIEDYKDDYCPECYSEIYNESKKKNEEISYRSSQKKQLSTLFKMIPYDIESRKNFKLYCKTPKPGIYHLLSLDWLIHWKNYLENLDLTITPVNNSELLCKHEKLMYNIKDYMDDSEKNDVFAIIPDSTWQTLIELYGGGPDLLAIFNNDEILGIEICVECSNLKSLEREQSERQFKNATIEFEFIDERGVNKRLQRNRRKKIISIDGVNYDDSIKHLKLLIFQYHNICPNEQTIYYEDKLLNESKTLKEYNVSKKGKWKLIYNDPIDVLISSEDSKNESNLGFGSTMLSLFKGNNTIKLDEESEIDIIEIDKTNKKRKRESDESEKICTIIED